MKNPAGPDPGPGALARAPGPGALGWIFHEIPRIFSKYFQKNLSKNLKKMHRACWGGV